ncbi:MAG: PD-(D/E)XK nuclease family protein, partial [Paenibacillaceae bacterium]
MAGQWTEQLYAHLSKNPFRKKILITNGYAQGHQWLEQACRSYGPLMNTEVQTVESLVLASVKHELSVRKLRYVTDGETFWIVQHILEQLTTMDESYLPQTMLTPGVIHSFHKALTELRHAGVTGTELQPESFDSAAKALFIQNLLMSYEALLVTRRFVDFPGLLPIVNEVNRTLHVLIYAEHLQLTYVEKKMLEQLSMNEPIILSGEISFVEEQSEFPVETTAFFHATSVLAEVREVYRRLAENGCAWDEVEVIASNYQRYAPAFYTMASQYGVKCTFAKGVSLHYTRTGIAALLYLDWLESGYHVDHLLKGIKHRHITLPLASESISRGSIIRELEQSGIGWGRQRYKIWIDSVKRDPEVDYGPLTDRQLVKIESQQALVVLFEELFANVPEGDLTSPMVIVAGLVDYIQSYTKGHGQEEKGVTQAIAELVTRLSLASTSGMDIQLAIQYVRAELEQITTHSTSIPAEGMLHISSLQDGGQSGRAHIYIVGMEDSSWSISTRQDPILLDEERVRVSEFLPTSTQTASWKHAERVSRLGQIRGTCTLSFASYDIVDNRELNPAYELLQLFRKKVGQPEADYAALYTYLPSPIGYPSATTGMQIDETDVWLNHLITPQLQIKQGTDLILAAYTHIGEGNQAIQGRDNPLFSKYDGSLDTSEHTIDYVSRPDAYISVSKLELFGRCPLQFYYQEVLSVRAKDVAVYDRTRWLDAMQKGSLLHAVFYQYYTELLMRGSVLTHDLSLLQTLTEKMLQEYTLSIPAPSTQIWQKECEGIRQDVKIFYANEQGGSSTPKYLELELHHAAGLFQLELSEDLTLPIKGYVDRVDEIAPHQYKILDYKSGGTKKYKANEFFSGGTQLQHALYAEAVEQYLRESGLDPAAEVVESAYVFPTERGMGNEVVRVQNRKEDLAKLIQHMLDAMRDGVFPPTKDPMNCNWCDYQGVCDGHAE